MQQQQSLHGKANNLLQHSREDDANQGSAILVLELPSDVEAEAGVPGGNGQLDVVSVLGANGQGAGGFNVSGLASLSLGDGERDGDSGDDSVDDGVDGGGSSGGLELDDHGSVRSFREEARGLGYMKEKNKNGPQMTMCFKVKDDVSQQSDSDRHLDASCLCLETYGSNYLGFHNVSNTILHEIITSIQRDWPGGVLGVSMGVSSVISDYTANMPAIISSAPGMVNKKFIQLEGDPWTCEDVKGAEMLQMCLIACLIKEGYKTCMDVNIDTASRVFFFIKNSEDTSAEVLVPDMAGISIGKGNRPKVVRSKSSFFRTYKGRSNSMKKKTKASIRKKLNNETVTPAMTYKPTPSKPAWWQQTSTDISSDHEDDIV